jgi:formate hydrogenlyase subunit 4
MGTAELQTMQAVLYLAISPVVTGTVQWFSARMQGRRGADPLQPYRDLTKLAGKAPSIPDTATGIFVLAPAVAFTSALLLGFAVPGFYAPAGSGMDLLLVIGLLGLARFAVGLAAFDAGSSFGPLAAGRQWYVHVLAEPALVMAVYVLALSRATTNLPSLGAPVGEGALALEPLLQPMIPLAIVVLAYVLLAESGRLPVDNPATHLELTMVEEGTELEYSGRALALMRWAQSMRLTFGLSLIAFLSWPPPAHAGDPSPLLALGIVGYLAKLVVLSAALAIWERGRVKVRLRAVSTQLLIATGVLVFAVVTLVLAGGGVGSG